MEYFIYISASKVDMLLPQVPLAIKGKVAAEVGVNVGVLTAKVKSETERDLSAESARVRIVADYIRENENVARLEDCKPWVSDKLAVKHIAVESMPELYLLVGKRGEMYHLLGGSTHHVIGNQRPASVTLGYSYAGYLAKKLTEMFNDDKYADTHRGLSELFGEREVIPGIRAHEWADVVYDLYEDSEAVPFNIEFLARFLSLGRSLRGVTCTMSSPLYVTQL